MTWAWALDVGVGGDADVAVGAVKIPDRTSGGWYKALRAAGLLSARAGRPPMRPSFSRS